MKINFKCHACGKSHYTKQNLTEVNGHLVCSACAVKAGTQLPIIFEVVYRTARTTKTTRIKLDTEYEVRKYVLESKQLRAKSIISVTRNQ